MLGFLLIQEVHENVKNPEENNTEYTKKYRNFTKSIQQLVNFGEISSII